MKKIGLIIKEEGERILKGRLQASDTFLLVKYSGLSAPDLNILRSSLSDVDSSLMVVKNSISKRIFKPYQDLSTFIEGPCGIIFVNKDLIATSKIVNKFMKERPNLEIKAGLLKDRMITQEEIKNIAKIPSLSALQSQVIGGLKSPICGLVFSLKQILNKLVWALNKIKDKKSK